MIKPSYLPEELIELRAHQIWQKRQLHGREETSRSDWEEAFNYLRNHHLFVFWWRFRKVLKEIGKLISKLLNFSFWLLWRFFKLILRVFKQLMIFFWKVLPKSDWVKLLAAPVVLSIAGAWITARFQEENRQNETINKYFEQVEKLVVDQGIDLLRLDNPIRPIIKGKSVAVLRSIDLKRKEIIIGFLLEFNLLNYQKDGISLSYFDLSGINLSGFKLIGINLEKTSLFKANLQGTDLRGANLGMANLQQADLLWANLQQARLWRVNLRNAFLWGVNFQNANLLDAKLQDANLRWVKLQNADLTSAKLQNANLENANLQNANLYAAKLQNANLENANLQNAILIEIEDLTAKQIKSTCFWDRVIYKGEWNEEEKAWVTIEPDNAEFIEGLKNDTASDPDKPPNCSLWENRK